MAPRRYTIEISSDDQEEVEEIVDLIEEALEEIQGNTDVDLTLWGSDGGHDGST